MMNSNMPNHESRADDQAAPQGSAHDLAYAESNSYCAQHQAAAGTPDLDAGAPTLRSNEMQRLNRKALLFLAGIVALLIAAAIWMVNGATAAGESKPRVVEQEVNIPELPKGVGAEESVPVPAEPELPPLPVEDMADLQSLPQPPPMPLPYADAPGMAREPSLMERRMANVAGGENLQPTANTAMGGMMSPDAYARAMMGAAAREDASQPVEKARSAASSAQPLANADTLLLRGTYIRCVMETRIVTDVAGFTSCVVTEPVYSVNGRRLLLPKGSKISGRYENANISGPRVAVVWDRITTPNGIDVNMASPGVDNLGGAGHPGDYNAHWASRVSSALLISLVSDAFKYAGARHGPESTVVTNSGTEIVQPYESNTARAMERLANHAVDRSANRPPTVTINQGTVVNVYVAKDVDFSPVLR